MKLRWVGAIVVGAVAAIVACGGSDASAPGGSSGGTSGGTSGGSSGGTSGGSSGGTSGSSGETDASSDAPSEAGGGDKDAGDGCRSQADCKATMPGAFCTALVLPPLCGGQCSGFGGGECGVDGDCADAGTNYICDSQICNCPHGGAQPLPHCTKGCTTAADCGPGLVCNVAHRCSPASCSSPSQCGSADFTCDQGSCTAKPCTSDADCAGFCVNGYCSANPGFCQIPTP